MFALSYGLTDKQVELVKKQLYLLQQKKCKDYLQTKSNLKASNIESYLEYKEIALNPEIFTQLSTDRYFAEHKTDY